MSLSTRELRAEVRRLEERRRGILERLLRSRNLAVGTVSRVDRKCGKPGCHCAEGAGHRQMLFLFKDSEGRRRCKLIRKADWERMLRANQRYAAYRTGLKELHAVQIREHEILAALKESLAINYR